MAGVALAATVFCATLGSSSVDSLAGPGRMLRWVALLAFAGVGVVLVLRERSVHPSGMVGGMLVLGAWVAGLALVSTAWSVDPRLTFGRAATLTLLFLACGTLALVARERARMPEALLLGVLAGAVAAALGGVVVLAVDHAAAVQAAVADSPARFRGLGENPDTVAMLEGLASPIAFWLVLRGRTQPLRVAAAAALVLLTASISASGSRGGLVALLVGGLALAVASVSRLQRRALGVALAVCALAGVAAFGTTIPKPLSATSIAPGHQPVPTSSGPSSAGVEVGAPEQNYAGRLEDELYRVSTGNRSLFTSSGRLQTWFQAIKQGDARPLLGYGFGTENIVFIDRVFNFQGRYVENTLIGLYLQLGAIGVASVLALLVLVTVACVRVVRRREAPPASEALVGVIGAGAVLLLVQSYATSVGNVATVAFWTACFVVGATPGAAEWLPLRLRRRQEERTVARA